MAPPIIYSTVAAAAGGDPHDIALPVLTANPSEVDALGELFCSASDRAGDIEKWAIDGYQSAITAAVIADSTPMDLMSEVVESQKTLGLGRGSMAHIGTAMRQIAAQIPIVQQQLTDLITAAHQVVDAAVDAFEFGIAGQSDPVIIEQLNQQCWADAVQKMGTILSQVTKIVQSYDDFLNDRLSQLQTNFAYLAPTSLDDGEAPAQSAAMQNLTVQIPASSTPPKQVSTWWASLPAADQVALMSQSGSSLAVLHGLPAPVYDALNRREVTNTLVSAQARDAAEAQYDVDAFMAKNFPELTPFDVLEGPKSAQLQGKYPQLAWELNNLMTVLAAANAASAVGGTRAVQSSLVGGPAPKYLLEYHPDSKSDDKLDDSQAVIALGNPDTADNLVVEVPGTSNSASDMPELVTIAEQTSAAMNAADSGANNVVIAYMGYDAPDTIAVAASSQYGQEAAAALSADLLGYDAANTAVDGASPSLTVIGHSYGAYLDGLALSQSPEGLVDNFIYMGAPGLGVDNVSALNVDPQNVYGVINGLDPVPSLGSASNKMGSDFGPSPYSELGGPIFGGQYLDGAPFGFHDYYGKPAIVDELAAVAVAG